MIISILVLSVFLSLVDLFTFITWLSLLFQAIVLLLPELFILECISLHPSNKPNASPPNSTKSNSQTESAARKRNMFYVYLVFLVLLFPTILRWSCPFDIVSPKYRFTCNWSWGRNLHVTKSMHSLKLILNLIPKVHPRDQEKLWLKIKRRSSYLS